MLDSLTLHCKQNRLGLQHAAQKQWAPSQKPGAWAGSVIHVSSEEVHVSVTLECWQKTRDIITWIKGQLEETQGFRFKTLESNRGFLIYTSRTYPAAVPYLKGINLMLDSWWPWRKEDGWILTLKEMRVAIDQLVGANEMGPDAAMLKAPKLVIAVPRLARDVEVLECLFSVL